MTAVSCYSTLDISANCINGTHPESSIASCEAVHGLQPSFPSLHLQHIARDHWYYQFSGAT